MKEFLKRISDYLRYELDFFELLSGLLMFLIDCAASFLMVAIAIFVLSKI